MDYDLKRPLAHFEDFLDHVTDHMNNYESLRSFNQPVSNITKIQTFKESIKQWPQFDTLITTWEIDNNNVLVRDFAQFTDYRVNQYGNLPTDVQPRGGNAYNVRQSGKPKGKGKDEKGKGKHIRQGQRKIRKRQRPRSGPLRLLGRRRYPVTQTPSQRTPS